MFKKIISLSVVFILIISISLIIMEIIAGVALFRSFGKIIDDASTNISTNSNSTNNNNYNELQKLEKKFVDLTSKIITEKPNLYSYYYQHLQQLQQQLKKINHQDSVTIKYLLNKYNLLWMIVNHN